MNDNNKNIKIALLIRPLLPVPSVKGGAVEELITILAEQNEIFKKAYFDIYCIYDREAKKTNLNWKYSKIFYHKNVYFFYRILGFIFRKFFKKELYPNGHYFKYTFKKIRRRKYDAIVAVNSAYIAEIGDLCKHLDLSKMIAYVHSADKANEFTKFNFSKVIGVSDYVRDLWISTAKPVNYEGVTVHNCVRNERFLKKISEEDKIQLRQKLGFSSDDFVVLFVGRICKEKGILELINAILNCNKSNVKLMIIGTSNVTEVGISEYVRKVIDNINQHTDKIIHIGSIDNWELPSYYQISDLQVIPSLCEDAAPLVAIEGMLSGLPLVVTKSGGMVEYVDTECALILEKDEKILEMEDKTKFITQLSNAISELYVDEKRRKNMSEHAKRRGQQFNPERFYNDFINAILL